MTIENHIKRIKEKYADQVDLQLAKLYNLGLQLGLGYGAKQIIKKEIDELIAKGASLKTIIPDKKRVKDYSFNLTRTGGGVYDDLIKQLNGKSSGRINHSFYGTNPVTVEIKEMSPTEYIRQCARIMGVTEAALRESRQDKSMENLSKLNTTTTFNLPYIDYVKNSQDGLHRAILAEKANHNKIPVLIVRDKLIQSSSEEALKKNIETEIRAGKDPKQASAIAYAVQRKNDSTKIVDVTASNSAELTKIINNFLASKPGLKPEDIDIRGNILTGTFRIFINGGDVLVNYNPSTGGIIQHTLKVNRSNNTVSQSDVNDMIRKFYENSERVKQAQLTKTPAKLLYVIIEFTESDYYALASKVGKQMSVDEAEKLIKNADEAKRAKGTQGGYDETYVDVVVQWGDHKYRIHFLRFDVGDGAQYMNVRQQVDNLLKRVPDFMTNASYRNYMKQIDRKSILDASQKLAEYTKVENGELIQGMLVKHDLGLVFISSNPSDDENFSTIEQAQNYINSKHYNKVN